MENPIVKGAEKFSAPMEYILRAQRKIEANNEKYTNINKIISSNDKVVKTIKYSDVLATYGGNSVDWMFKGNHYGEMIIQLESKGYIEGYSAELEGSV